MAVYLLEQQIPTEAMRAAAYYGQTPGIEDAIAAGYGAAPLLRNDVDPALADALGLKQGQAIGVDQLSQILSGNRADGTALPVQHQHREVRTYGKDDDGDAKLRHRVAYLDLTLSAPKHRLPRPRPNAMPCRRRTALRVMKRCDMWNSK